ncbi:hypothetical protein KIPB_010556, partial [Kipferlia bialata]
SSDVDMSESEAEVEVEDGLVEAQAPVTEDTDMTPDQRHLSSMPYVLKVPAGLEEYMEMLGPLSPHGEILLLDRLVRSNSVKARTENRQAMLSLLQLSLARYKYLATVCEREREVEAEAEGEDLSPEDLACIAEGIARDKAEARVRLSAVGRCFRHCCSEIPGDGANTVLTEIRALISGFGQARLPSILVS